MRIDGAFGTERTDFMDILYSPELRFEVRIEKKYLATDMMRTLVISTASCNKIII